MSGPHVEASEREALYRIMALRRDCRHFTPGP
ncbi:MAG TPA: 5,6-dimethylbenzimidazole synthase, partial [Cupriavidus sp.]|nr:5,6-dimethylbenzimidazole synthase [Cupriavidus sp.]